MANRPGMEIGSHKVTIVSLQERKERQKMPETLGLMYSVTTGANNH